MNCRNIVLNSQTIELICIYDFNHKKYLQIDNLILLIKLSILEVSYDINQTNVNSSSLIMTLSCSNICFVLSPVSNESKYTT